MPNYDKRNGRLTAEFDRDLFERDTDVENPQTERWIRERLIVALLRGGYDVTLLPVEDKYRGLEA